MTPGSSSTLTQLGHLHHWPTTLSETYRVLFEEVSVTRPSLLREGVIQTANHYPSKASVMSAPSALSYSPWPWQFLLCRGSPVFLESPCRCSP